MKLSARNMIKGTVKSYKEGAVNDEVIVEIAPGIEITSIITSSSCDRLGIEVGKEVYVLIKASNVMLAAE
jgi:molybdopterin-binding protein